MTVRTARRRLWLEALEPRWVPAQDRPLATITWINPSDGDWSNAENWSGGRVPGATDDVAIGAGVVVTRQIGEDTVNSLACDGSLVVTGGSLMTSEPSSVAALTLGGGVVWAADGLTITDSFDWTGGALGGTKLDLFGAASIRGEKGMTLLADELRNHADLQWSSGTISGEKATIANLAGGVVRVTGAVGTDAAFANAGHLLIAVPAAASFGSFVQSAGETQAQGGTLSVARFDLRGGTLSGWGTIDGALDNGGVVAPAGGVLRVSGDYSQSSGGVLSLLAGADATAELKIGGTASLAGLLQFCGVKKSRKKRREVKRGAGRRSPISRARAASGG